MLNRFFIFVLFFVFTSQSVYALSRGECDFSNVSVNYSGSDFPGNNSVYLDGEVLGVVNISLNYRCRTHPIANSNSPERSYLFIGTRNGNQNTLGQDSGFMKSNTAGIGLKALSGGLNSLAGQSDNIILKSFMVSEGYLPDTIYTGSINKPLFSVVKTGVIQTTNSSVNLNTDVQLSLISSQFNSGPSYLYEKNVIPSTQSINIFNATCNISHPATVTVPSLVKSVREEVSSHFNVTLNCSNKAVMQNSIQLTVKPVDMTHVTLTGDKTSLLYSDGEQMVVMNIFNSVAGAETMMQFSTMYQFSNDSQGSSFTIPMRARFQLGSSSGYGNFRYQAQISVRYN